MQGQPKTEGRRGVRAQEPVTPQLSLQTCVMVASRSKAKRGFPAGFSLTWSGESVYKRTSNGAALVAEWVRIRLPMQRTRV